MTYDQGQALSHVDSPGSISLSHATRRWLSVGGLAVVTGGQQGMGKSGGAGWGLFWEKILNEVENMGTGGVWLRQLERLGEGNGENGWILIFMGGL